MAGRVRGRYHPTSASTRCESREAAADGVGARCTWPGRSPGGGAGAVVGCCEVQGGAGELLQDRTGAVVKYRAVRALKQIARRGLLRAVRVPCAPGHTPKCDR